MHCIVKLQKGKKMSDDTVTTKLAKALFRRHVRLFPYYYDRIVTECFPQWEYLSNTAKDAWTEIASVAISQMIQLFNTEISDAELGKTAYEAYLSAKFAFNQCKEPEPTIQEGIKENDKDIETRILDDHLVYDDKCVIDIRKILILDKCGNRSIQMMYGDRAIALTYDHRHDRDKMFDLLKEKMLKKS